MTDCPPGCRRVRSGRLSTFPELCMNVKFLVPLCGAIVLMAACNRNENAPGTATGPATTPDTAPPPSEAPPPADTSPTTPDTTTPPPSENPPPGG